MNLLAFPVYRAPYRSGAFFRVGSIIEFRRRPDPSNRAHLVRMAQRVFARDEGEVVVVGARPVPGNEWE